VADTLAPTPLRPAPGPVEAPARPPRPSPPTVADAPVSRGRQVVRPFLRLLPVVLAGYALFDRGGAWIHVPGIPLFAGELMLVLALLVVAGATGTVLAGATNRIPCALLLVFILWGLLRTVPYVGTYHIDAVRDAALWYYAVFAFVVAGLVVAMPRLPKQWVGAYRRFLPWLLAWSFIALQLDQRTGGPYVPDSPLIPWFSHKSGNVAVHAAIALAFLWLVPIEGMRRRTRVLLTASVGVLVAVSGTQSRSGMIAAGAAITVTWLMAWNRRQMIACILAPVVLVLALAWAINFQVPAHPRPISVPQLLKNVASLSGGGSSELSDTAQWRDDLWTSLLKETRQSNKLVTGWGFGPNLAAQMGFAGQNQESPLRSPHNSHLDVLARMGVIGLAVWISLWVAWFATMLRSRHRLRSSSQRFTRGLMSFAIAGVVAILVNAYFDPTLESPQVAIWLWSLFGLGLGLVARERLAGEQPAALNPAG
jgi:O-antigen ligase